MIISSIYKSLQRSVNDIITEIKDVTGHQEVEYWSWENRGDESELPKATLLGVSGMEFIENGGLWTVRWAIGVSPWQDLNLDKQLEILDIIYERLGERKKVNLLHPTTGDLVSEMVVTDFHVAPATTTELRNYRVVSMELRRTDTATPA